MLSFAVPSLPFYTLSRYNPLCHKRLPQIRFPCNISLLCCTRNSTGDSHALKNVKFSCFKLAKRKNSRKYLHETEKSHTFAGT